MIPKTYFIDLDGVCLRHWGSITEILLNKAEVLPGVLHTLNQLERNRCTIILVSGRPSSMYEFTKKQLNDVGIFYNQLILNITGNPRVIVNDRKKNGDNTAFCINVDRNEGLTDLPI